MEVVNAARELRDILLVYDKAAKQIDVLDHSLVQSNQRTLAMVMDGCRGHARNQMMRTCVLEGVREMYSQTRQRKWQQLQKKAREILENMDDGVGSLTEPAADSLRNMEAPVAGGTKSFTQEMMSDFSQCCRST